MEIIDNTQLPIELKDNTLIGNPKLTNSKIVFKGKGNILYCDKDVHLVNSILSFNGDNSIIFLSQNRHKYVLNVAINNDSVLYFGKNNYINGRLNLVISEQKNIIVGNECLFSFDCWLRTADVHLIYDSNTKGRINPSKSIYLGDHIWVGQHTFILKGTQIGSGSILGGLSVASGKKIESNSSYAGNPVRKIRDSIFFSNDSVHTYREAETKEHLFYEDDRYIYSNIKEEMLPFSVIEKSIENLNSSKERLDYLIKNLQNNNNKNRFFIGKSSEKHSFLKKVKHYLKF